MNHPNRHVPPAAGAASARRSPIWASDESVSSDDFARQISISPSPRPRLPSPGTNNNNRPSALAASAPGDFARKYDYRLREADNIDSSDGNADDDDAHANMNIDIDADAPTKSEEEQDDDDDDDDSSVSTLNPDEYFEDTSTLSQIMQNDPDLTTLKVEFGDYCFSSEVNWYMLEDGCREKNTSLSKLVVAADEAHQDDTSRQKLRECCLTWLADNSSIEHFRCEFDHNPGLLRPFVQHNPKLRHLELIHCSMNDEKVVRRFASTLSRRTNKSSLRSIKFLGNDIDSQGSMELIATLKEYPNLIKLSFHSNSIHSAGCAAIGSLLTRPTCKLKHLDLRDAVDDESLAVLATALANNSSLKKLNLGANRWISADGWNAFAKALSQQHQHGSNHAETTTTTSLQQLYLYNNNMNDARVAAVGGVITKVSTLKMIELSFNDVITAKGWSSFAVSLIHSGLETLCFRRANVTDMGIVALASAIAASTTIKSVDLHRNETISAFGWLEFFDRLRNNSNNNMIKLTSLDLSWNGLGDDPIQTLAAVFANNKTLKKLVLDSNPSVGPGGWQVLSRLLQNDNTVLEELCIDNRNINDDVIITYANALVNNTTLKKLWIGSIPRHERNLRITSRGLEPLAHVLCNKSSIDATYSSNHTLETMFDSLTWPGLPEDLVSSLESNKNANKVEVARHKILQHNQVLNIQEFIDMDLKILPRVFGYLARDALGQSPLYTLLRALPSSLGPTIHSPARMINNNKSRRKRKSSLLDEMRTRKSFLSENGSRKSSVLDEEEEDELLCNQTSHDVV